MKNRTPWIIAGIFLLITIVFFYKIFLGYSIQGGDFTGGIQQKWASITDYSHSLWHYDLLMGMGGGSLPNTPFALLIRVIPHNLLQAVEYFLVIISSLVFFYMLMRDFRMSVPSSVFGAIIYSLMPVSVSLIYSGHFLTVEYQMLVPLLILLLKRILTGAENGLRRAAAIVAAGAVWGIMLNDDIQRGLYLSVALIPILVYWIHDNAAIKKPSDYLKSSAFLRNILALLIIGGVLLGSFASGIQGWLPGLSMRQAQTKAIADPEQEKEIKYQMATQWSFHPAELIDSLASGFHGRVSGNQEQPYWGNLEYAGSSVSLGFFTLLFAVIGFTAYFRRNRFVLISGIVAVIFLILSFGKFFPALFWFYYQLPLMKNFRAPVKFLTVLTVFLPILATFGFHSITQEWLDESRREKLYGYLKNGLFVLAGLSVLLMLILMIGNDGIAESISGKSNGLNGTTAVNNAIGSVFRMLIFTVAVIGAILVIQKKSSSKNAVLAASISLILFASFDVISTNWFYLDQSYYKASETYKGDQVIGFLKAEDQKAPLRAATSFFIPTPDDVRPYPVTGLKSYYHTYLFPYFGLYVMDYTAISGKIPEYEVFMKKALEARTTGPVRTVTDLADMNLRLMQLANVRYVLADGNIGSSNYILTNALASVNGNPIYIWAVPGALPRLGFYTGWTNARTQDEAAALLADPRLNIQKMAIITATNEISAKPVEDAVRPLPLSQSHFSKLTADIETDKPGFVVFSSYWTKDWKARVNGKPVQVYPAFYLMGSVYLDAGRHRVEFAYEPDSRPFIVSVVVAIAGLIGLLYLMITRKQTQEQN